MKLVVVFLALLNTVLGNQDLHTVPFGVSSLTNVTIGDHVSSRIYGGLEAPPGKFPFMVFVLMQDKYGELHRCSGSLVAKNWVLVAGQCIMDEITAKDFIVLGGATNLGYYLNARILKPFDEVIKDTEFGVQERRVSAFYVHPDFDKKTLMNDLALLRLKTPFTEQVKAQNITKQNAFHHNDCVIIGWGLNENNLFDGKLKYGEHVTVNSPFIGCLTKTSGPVLCLDPGVKGFCHGDSGGPLVCDGFTWGVASYFVTRADESSCTAHVEEFYTNLYYSRDWLNSHISGGSKLKIISANTIILILLCISHMF